MPCRSVLRGDFLSSQALTTSVRRCRSGSISGLLPLVEPLLQRLADGQGWTCRERLPWAPSGTAPNLLKENTTIKDMIEALHSPGVLYGRASAIILHRVRSSASLPPQSLPVAFQAKAVGGSLNSKLKFLHSAVSNCHRNLF